jgi:hypothetical protein
MPLGLANCDIGEEREREEPTARKSKGHDDQICGSLVNQTRFVASGHDDQESHDGSVALWPTRPDLWPLVTTTRAKGHDDQICGSLATKTRSVASGKTRPKGHDDRICGDDESVLDVNCGVGSIGETSNDTL